MATRDFGLTENKDLGEKEEVRPSTVSNPATVITAIKNAHATGDGSYGRSDDSIPEKTDEDNRSETDNNY